MAKKRISDVLIDVLANAGIERIYGITGDSLNSVNDSLRRNGKIAFEHVRQHPRLSLRAFGKDAEHPGGLSGAPARHRQLFCARKAHDGDDRKSGLPCAGRIRKGHRQGRAAFIRVREPALRARRTAHPHPDRRGL